VLARYVGAARDAHADVVVRVTSDCPLLCPEVSERVVKALVDAGRDRVDYASNTQTRTYARGLDTEAVWRDALECADREATSAGDREHVTPFIWSQPDRFRLLSVEQGLDESHLRWTVDTPEDLELARRIYAALAPTEQFGLSEIRGVMASHPDWMALNQAIEQKAVLR
jgi:spore coat polysaccharide biosynthesis protein SpsF